MYIDNPLFIASIATSLLDMGISVFKLARYKHGPWQRIRNAFAHLHRSRDPAAYEQLKDTDYDWCAPLACMPVRVLPPTIVWLCMYTYNNVCQCKAWPGVNCAHSQNI